jgi:hypothetical protein
MIRMSPAALFLLALALLLAGTRTAHAAQSYDNCTGFIDTVPAVIVSQGNWCFRKDLSTAITSGNAITIANNNVTIDCNDFKLSGLAAGSGTIAFGIVAQDRFNVTVRRCNIRGFAVGLNIFGSEMVSTTGGHQIEDNHFDGNTFQGMWLEGDGSVVQRNRVSNTGGTTADGGGNSYGIITNGSVDVRENTVTHVVAKTGSGGYAYGIYVLNNPDGSIDGNRVRILLNDGAGIAYGIYAESSGSISLRNNDLVGYFDASGSVGLACNSGNAHAKDNEINTFVTGLTGCSDDGGNVIAP